MDAYCGLTCKTGNGDMRSDDAASINVIWSSSDAAKVMISGGGLATGVDIGSATITASHDEDNSGNVTGTTLTVT